MFVSRLLLLLLITGCSTPQAPSSHTTANVVVTSSTPASAPLVVKVDPPAPTEDLVFVTDPAVLAALEIAGMTFSERLGGPAGGSNKQLAEIPRWRSIVEVLEREISDVQRADPEAGVTVARYVHRLFDARWLRGTTARFELIGVSNRVDHRPQHGCGDVRLLYRLAYATQVKGQPLASRLPMTVNLEYLVPDDGQGCRAAAARWRLPAGLAPEALAARLTAEGGPLGPARGVPRTVQLNQQIVRWPSAVRPDLGGHAEYLLRSFRPDGERFVPMPLDNTPDVARLNKDPALRGELHAWIEANLDGIDTGVAQLPEKFLATRAVSVSPRGLSRRANRPFRQIFAPGDVAGLALDGKTTIGSPEALLRRLDDATCVGCHQGRTIAGFHFLGDERPGGVPANSLAEARSPHLADEVARRTRLVAELIGGKPGDFSRPPSERGSQAAPYGARCGLGDPGFKAWTCDAGLRCEAYDIPADDAAVGVCLPEKPSLGDPCQVGRLRPSADPHRDATGPVAARACPDNAVCNVNKVGFPGGMCTSSCEGLDESGTCGAIALLVPFNNCLARAEPFSKCLAENVAPSGLRACSTAKPCRDDYICVQNGGGTTGGACIPPYFLFQLRVDGHPPG
jgi:hypothetical protein